MDDEWGPMIEHDGRGCPCVGMYARRILSTGGVGKFDCTDDDEWEIIGIVVVGPCSAWDWNNFGKVKSNGLRTAKVIRYSIRTPRALVQLRTLIADKPQTVSA